MSSATYSNTYIDIDATEVEATVTIPSSVSLLKGNNVSLSGSVIQTRSFIGANNIIYGFTEKNYFDMDALEYNETSQTLSGSIALVKVGMSNLKPIANSSGIVVEDVSIIAHTTNSELMDPVLNASFTISSVPDPLTYTAYEPWDYNSQEDVSLRNKFGYLPVSTSDSSYDYTAERIESAITSLISDLSEGVLSKMALTKVTHRHELSKDELEKITDDESLEDRISAPAAVNTATTSAATVRISAPGGSSDY